MPEPDSSHAEPVPTAKPLLPPETVVLALVPILAYGLALTYELRFAAVWGIPTGWVRVNPGALIVPVGLIFLIAIVLWGCFVISLLIAMQAKKKWVRMLAMMLYPLPLVLVFGWVFLSVDRYAIAAYLALMPVGWIWQVYLQGDPLEHVDADDSDASQSPLQRVLWLPIDSLKQLGVPGPRAVFITLGVAVFLMYLTGEFVAKNGRDYHLIEVGGTDYLILRSYQSEMIVVPFDTQTGLAAQNEVRLFQDEQVVNTPVRQVHLAKSPFNDPPSACKEATPPRASGP